MSLQQQVNLYPDVAIEGSTYRTPVNSTSGLSSVATTVGRGVFSSVTSNGVIADSVSNVKGASGVLVGIAYRANLAPMFNIAQSSSMVVPDGYTVSILTSGSVWVNNTVSASAMGNFVFISNVDGTITTQDTDTAIADYTITDYKVIGMKTTGAINTLLLISNV